MFGIFAFSQTSIVLFADEVARIFRLVFCGREQFKTRFYRRPDTTNTRQEWIVISVMYILTYLGNGILIVRSSTFCGTTPGIFDS